ncbi:MAG: hypothetical protein A3E85_02065 [Gammaproteobacteria bacterium RIFCSPHIGHO2_12_FULL_45_12]|nr:MAG: hypothetical protein A3E85_02065 [Gammaproteobacteria bacterium RIFCSPHIGHO2_12_FULL_45_12]
MAGKIPEVVEIQNHFYRDGFGRVLGIGAGLLVALGVLLSLSVYLYVSRPPPVVFAVEKDWRVQPLVPLNQPYLTEADMLQWVSEVIPKAFTYDFKNYNQTLTQQKPYFTADGWEVFLNQLNIYVNYTTVQTDRLFTTAAPSRAPTVLQKGLLGDGRYYWVVELPVDISYIGQKITRVRTLMLKLVVVRVPTLSNLVGVGVDNVIVDASS